MKTSYAWLPALLLIAAAACAGESPAPEKPEADAKAKYDEKEIQKRVAEILEVFESSDAKTVKELRDTLAKEGESVLPVLKTAGYVPNLELKVQNEIREAKKALYKAHPNLAFKVSVFSFGHPIRVLPPDTGPFEVSKESFPLLMGIHVIEIENISDMSIVIARPQEGSPTSQEYPNYQIQFLDKDGKDVSRKSEYDIRKNPFFSSSDFITINPDEYWGTQIEVDWPRPPKAGKYKMRLRYVMPKAEHKCADEAAKKLADEASIGEVFSNTVDIEFVFPSKEELKKMGVVQDEKEEKSAKKEEDEK